MSPGSWKKRVSSFAYTSRRRAASSSTIDFSRIGSISRSRPIAFIGLRLPTTSTNGPASVLVRSVCASPERRTRPTKPRSAPSSAAPETRANRLVCHEMSVRAARDSCLAPGARPRGSSKIGIGIHRPSCPKRQGRKRSSRARGGATSGWRWNRRGGASRGERSVRARPARAPQMGPPWLIPQLGADVDLSGCVTREADSGTPVAARRACAASTQSSGAHSALRVTSSDAA